MQQHDEFDLYSLILEDTETLSSRRRQLDSLYVATVTLILGGSAYVAFYSQFDNWLVVFVTFGIAVVGTAVAGRWSQGSKNLNAIIDLRYQFLRKLEQTSALQRVGAAILSQEWSTIYQPRLDRKYRMATRRLQSIFVAVFWLIPCLLASLTLITTVPDIHNLIPPNIFQHVKPLAPPVATPK